MEQQTVPEQHQISPDNHGFQLLKKMGWHEGHGLGRKEQGVLEPPSDCEPDKAKADFVGGHHVEAEDKQLEEEEQTHKLVNSE